MLRLQLNKNVLINTQLNKNSVRFLSNSAAIFAGHSKWANIKHKKAANDAAKANASFKISRKITMLGKQGGTDLSTNLGLAYTIEKAKELSIPKRVIEAALKRASGELKNDAKVETVIYEGLAPGGVAVVIEAITDNKNRTIGFIRPVFNKYSLNMTPTLYMFEKKGLILFDKNVKGEVEFDQVFEEMIDIGCEDVNEIPASSEGDESGDSNSNSGLIEVVTDPSDYGKIANEIKNNENYLIKEMQIGYVPNPDTTVEISDPETRESYDKFMSLLDEVDDITNVYSNLIED
ncbi:hypothetical protein B5S33_g5664 [[Candida] boidinii]|nr:hypothetical protein B5S33_g5664 [[Candida] boidinii]